MLALTCERARLARRACDILDLGCGWGSLSLWLAEHYPNARVTGRLELARPARASSRPRRRAAASRTSRSSPPTSTTSSPSARFDRVISIEMFEHMRNWKELLRAHRRLARARTGRRSSTSSRHRTPRLPLRGHLGGRALLHRRADALARPAAALPGRPRRRRPLGACPARTTRGRCGAWLERLDATPSEALAILDARQLGAARRAGCSPRWRLFLLSTAEIWGWRGGDEWLVSHYLLERARRQRHEAARARHVLRVARALGHRALEMVLARDAREQQRHHQRAGDRPPRAAGERDQAEPPPDAEVAEVVRVAGVAPQPAVHDLALVRGVGLEARPAARRRPPRRTGRSPRRRTPSHRARRAGRRRSRRPAAAARRPTRVPPCRPKT